MAKFARHGVPSRSLKQHRFMQAIAHGWRKPGGGGPSQEVGKEFVAADKGKYDAEEDQQQQLPTAEEFLAAGRKPTPKPTPEITLSMPSVPHHTAADIAPGAPGAQLPTAEEFLAAGRAKPEVARKPLPTAEEFLAAGRPAGAAAPEPTDDLSMIAAAHKSKLDLAA